MFYKSVLCESKPQISGHLQQLCDFNWSSMISNRIKGLMSLGNKLSFFAHSSKLSELSRVFSKSCNLIWLICVQVFSGKLNSNKPNFQLSLNFPVTSGRREFPRGFPSKMEHFSDWHPLSCIPILCLCLCLCTFVYHPFLLCPEMEHFSDWHLVSCSPIPFKLFLSLPTPSSQFPHFQKQVGWGN